MKDASVPHSISIPRRRKIFYGLTLMVTLGWAAFSFGDIVWVRQIKRRINPPRVYQTSFESLADFEDFYIVVPGTKGATHELSKELVRTGAFAHKAWVTQVMEPSTPTQNNNHRGYPTVQLTKRPGGSYRCPCEVTFWVWVNAELRPRTPENEWLSFATFTSDESDDWKRTVLVNLSYDGFVHLMHVPSQGEAKRIFQTTKLRFPMRQWIQLKVYLDMDAKNGIAKVWQDGRLVSEARVEGGNGKLAQAHFGLYAAPTVSQLTIYNDDLTIRELGE